MMAFAGLVALVFVVIGAGGFAVSCARAFAAGDFDPCDDDDVYCPHCGSEDIHDFDHDWFACHGCQMLYRGSDCDVE